MPFSLAIFSADSPMVRPVEGSLRAGGLGNRSTGLRSRNALAFTQSIFGAIGLDQGIDEAVAVENGRAAQRVGATADDHIRHRRS